MLDGLRPRLLRRNSRYRSVFTGPLGEYVRDDLYKLGCVGRPTYVPGDPMATAFNEGKRFMALHIASILGMSDEEIVARAQQQIKEIDDG